MGDSESGGVPPQWSKNMNLPEFEAMVRFGKWTFDDTFEIVGIVKGTTGGVARRTAFNEQNSLKITYVEFFSSDSEGIKKFPGIYNMPKNVVMYPDGIVPISTGFLEQYLPKTFSEVDYSKLGEQK